QLALVPPRAVERLENSREQKDQHVENDGDDRGDGGPRNAGVVERRLELGHPAEPTSAAHPTSGPAKEAPAQRCHARPPRCPPTAPGSLATLARSHRRRGCLRGSHATTARPDAGSSTKPTGC